MAILGRRDEYTSGRHDFPPKVSKKTNHLWKAEWGYQAYFTSFESNKAGVCILFNNNFNLQFQRLYTDPAGRFIIIINPNEKFLTLANIYAPNEDKPSFFQNFYDFKCEDIIIAAETSTSFLISKKTKKVALPKLTKIA